MKLPKQVIDPQTNVSVFERRKAHDVIEATTTEAKKKVMDEKDLKLGAMGSGSDYSSFIQHAGIPSLNLGYGGEDDGGEYHSIYDSYYDFIDALKIPDFNMELHLPRLQAMQF